MLLNSGGNSTKSSRGIPSVSKFCDESTLDDEYENNYRKYLAYARLLTPSKPLAEDLVQQAFLNVFKQIRKGKEIDVEILGGYIMKSIHNDSISIFRKSSKTQSVHVVNDDSHTPENIFEKNSEKQIVELAINSLPKVQRTAIVMYYFDGLKSKEISAELGISDSAVKTHIQRARKSLSEFIKSHGDEKPLEEVKL